MLELSDAEATEEFGNIADHNTYVKQAVIAYCKFPHSQGFAVMIDGRWGSGKTHLVKSILNDIVDRDPLQPPNDPLYISLYGVATGTEIDEQIYQLLHPFLSHKYTRLAGAVFKNFMKLAVKIDIDSSHDSVSVNPSIPDLKMSEIADGASRRVLIFDDFERAVMSPVDVLAYINPFVEHDGCKVIVLVSEEELITGGSDAPTSNSQYERRKEKTIGRTYRVKADVNAAFNKFLTQVDNSEVNKYLASQKEEVVAVFRCSETENLRILKHFMWDFEKLWLCLTENQKAHTKAMRELLTLLCAATLELQSGTIRGSAFRRADVGHYMSIRRKNPDADAIAADQMFKRYPMVNFASMLLSPECIREIVLDSNVNKHRIQGELNDHPYFTTPDALPSWKALWHGRNLNVTEQEAALLRFAEDFENRTFRSEAEILHISGLCLWLSDIGQPGWERLNIVDRVKAYIRDVFSASEADLDNLTSTQIERRSGGAFNLGFMMNDDPRFGEIASHLDKITDDWRRKSYPRVADQLKRLMTDDSEAFLRDICFTNAGPSRYARLALLKCIPTSEFAEVFAQANYRDQEQIAMGLSIRYEQLHSEPELMSEIPWLIGVYHKISRLICGMPPIPRHYASGLLKQYIEKFTRTPLSTSADTELPDASPT